MTETILPDGVTEPGDARALVALLLASGDALRIGPDAVLAAVVLIWIPASVRPSTICARLDVFSHAAGTPPPEVGDLVAVLDVGAYGFTESMPLFLSHPVPAEVAT